MKGELQPIKELGDFVNRHGRHMYKGNSHFLLHVKTKTES